MVQSRLSKIYIPMTKTKESLETTKEIMDATRYICKLEERNRQLEKSLEFFVNNTGGFRKSGLLVRETSEFKKAQELIK